MNNQFSINMINSAAGMVVSGDLSDSIGSLRRTDFAFVTADANGRLSGIHAKDSIRSELLTGGLSPKAHNGADVNYGTA